MSKLVRFIRLLLFIGMIVIVSGLLYVSYLTFQNDDMEFNLVLNNTKLNLKTDTNFQLDYIVYPVDYNYGGIKFYSKDPKIAEVNEYTGYVEAKSPGNTTIVAKIANSEKEEYVTVKVSKNITTSEFKCGDYYVDINDELFLDYYKLSNNYKFTSSNPMVAVVEFNGLVKPINEGSTIITLSDGKNTSQTLVTVGSDISNKIVTESPIDIVQAIINKKTKYRTVNYNVEDTFDLVKLLEKDITIDSETSVKVDGKTIKYLDGIVTVLSEGKSKIYIENSNYKIVLTVKSKKVVEPQTEPEGEEEVPVDEITTIRIKGYDSYNYYYGDSITLKFVVTPISASTNVTWITSDSNIATVDNGKVKFVGTGKVTIKVVSSENKNVTDQVTFTITNKSADPIKVSSIDINGPSSLDVGKSYKYVANITPSNATNKNVKWTVDNSSIASIKSDGTLKGIKKGKVVLSCTCDGITKSISVQINEVVATTPPAPTNIPATSIKITGNTSLYIGDTTNLTATVTPSNTTDKLSWKSSDTNILTVTNGKIKGIKEGKVVVTATCGKISATYNVEVKKKDTTTNVESISLNKVNLSLEENKDFTLVTTIVPSNATNKTITYSSNNKSVATVDANGVIKAIKAGTAVITAISNNNKKATCSVTVTKPLDACDLFVQNNHPTSIDYKDFLSFKKDNDDFYVAKAAHECANRYKLPVNVSKATYNFYNAKNEESIIVETDTNFNKSTIIIHDEKIAKILSNNNIKLKELLPMYSIYTPELTSLQKNLKGMTFTQANPNVPELAGGNYFVHIENSNIKEYHRKHQDDTQKSNQNDNLIFFNGVRQNDMLTDSFLATDLSIREIPSTTLTFKNLKIKIYCNTSISYADYSNYARRGLNITRSNTVIDDVDFRYYNSDGSVEAPTIYYAYSFVGIKKTYNVIYKNSTVSAFRTYGRSNNPTSSYGFSFSNNVNLTFDSLKMSKDVMMSDIKVWGIIGSSHNKNLTYNNCTINRVDAHKGVHGLTVTNSTLGAWGVHVVGDGTMTLKNNTFKYTNQVVNLRPDYGGFWNGDIVIKNCVWEPSGNPVGIVNTHLYTNFDFGYDIYLPNVKINGLTINRGVSNIPIYAITESTYNSFKAQYPNVPHIPNSRPETRKVKALAKDNYSFKNVKTSSGSAVSSRLWK